MLLSNFPYVLGLRLNFANLYVILPVDPASNAASKSFKKRLWLTRDPVATRELVVYPVCLTKQERQQRQRPALQIFQFHHKQLAAAPSSYRRTLAFTAGFSYGFTHER